MKTPKEGEPLPWRPAHYIHWGPEERKVVIIEMFRLAEQYPKADEAWLVMKAQEVLQPHRRRSLRSMTLGRKTVKLYRVLCEIFDPETGEPREADGT